MTNSCLLVRLVVLHHYLLSIVLLPQVNCFCFQHFSHSSTISLFWDNRAASSLALNQSSDEIPFHKNDKNGSQEVVKEKYSEKEENADYPWSILQDWALRDSIPRYIIRIPVRQKVSNTLSKRETTEKKQELIVLSPFALWRSLRDDVPELSGYPIEFLQARYREMQLEERKNFDADDNSGKSSVTATITSLGSLPFLQDYKFSANGIIGTVYGLEGVADGSLIQTSTIVNVEESLPKGYVQTSEGSVCFELGTPKEDGERNSMIGADRRESSTKVISSALGVAKRSIENTSSSTASNGNLIPLSNAANDADGLLLRLGATTGILLAGATAVNMISHHMTVNVFWV